jgi:hypothetical protein
MDVISIGVEIVMGGLRFAMCCPVRCQSALGDVLVGDDDPGEKLQKCKASTLH